MRSAIRSSRARLSLRRFAREEAGVITVETLFIIPLMFFTMVMMFVFWDAFRAKTLSHNATVVVADIISRENRPVTPRFLDGMHTLYRTMISAPDVTSLRISSIGFNDTTGTYRVLWSYSTNVERHPLIETALAEEWLAEVTPNLDGLATLVLVESWQDYTPPLGWLIDTQDLYTRSFVWPRLISPLPCDWRVAPGGISGASPRVCD